MLNADCSMMEELYHCLIRVNCGRHVGGGGYSSIFR